MTKPVLGPTLSPTVSSTKNLPRIVPGTLLGDLVDTIDDLKKSGNRALKVTVNVPLGNLRNQLQGLSEEQAIAMQESIRVSGTLSNLSFGSYVASILYATSSIIGGYYLKSNNQPAGDQFIYSGALLLLNSVMTHQNGWDKISRFLSLGNQTVEQILQTIFPIAVTLFSYAWNARNLAGLNQDHKEKIENVEKLFKFVTLSLEVSKFYLKFKQGQADREIQHLDSLMSSKNLEVNQILLRRGRLQDTFDSIGNGLKKVVKNMFYTTADFAKNN